MEVVVDDKPKSKPIVSTPPQKQVATSKKTQEKQRFLLQVGSFKNLSDADSLKAKLAFLGIESKIQTVTVDNKSTWHRVQIGPILGRDKVDSLQKQLKQNSIDSLLMRAKQG
jgi:cell division protein FtsN